ncbi:MAG TPA: thiamine-phosphate kinase [Thermoanaerobaculia bacterium]|nr:thiamine-phosphate kinase [Thermoanaerobaculia bacterium]
MAEGGEDALVHWLRRHLGEPAAGLIGDDAAFLPLTGDWAATVDSQIAGVHFRPPLAPALLARRLLAVNLSDLAAVGAEPAFALLALAAPAGWDHRAFFRAFAAACRAHGVSLAGGDLARSPTLTATLALLGRRPPHGRWVRRDAARYGDVLWVGGTLGEAALGCRLVALGARWKGGGVVLPQSGPNLPPTLAAAARRAVARHLLPQPQIALGRWLGRRRRAAAIDLSDGLSRDLHRLLLASGVGAEIDAASLPLAPRAEPLCRELGCDPGELALHGGEDYVLLFALPAGAPAPPAGTAIGRITAEPGARLRGRRGEPLEPRGWDHLAGG